LKSAAENGTMLVLVFHHFASQHPTANIINCYILVTQILRLEAHWCYAT